MISAVISARNAARDLERFLPSLLAQDPPVHEVIVVDDGSSDDTGAVAEAAGCRVIRLPVRHGIPGARNMGAREATGEILAFLDGDTELRPGWSAALERAFEGEAAIVAGDLIYPEPRTLIEWYCAKRRVTNHDLEGKRGFLPFVCGAHFTVRREVFEEVGGFDATLPGAEDVDFCFRAQLAGHRVGWAPDAALVHWPRDALRPLLRQTVRNSYSDRVLTHKFRAFPFARMHPTRRGVFRTVAKSAGGQLLSGWGGDRRELAAPLLDGAQVGARKLGFRLAELELLLGRRAVPPPLEPVSAEQANTATSLPEGPVLLVVGDDPLAAWAIKRTLESGPRIIAAPPGLEEEALARWEEPAPWSLRVARNAHRAGWPIAVDLLAQRLERERPRTWGDAYLTSHAIHGLLRGRRPFALFALGEAGHGLAERLPTVPLVVAGRHPGADGRVLVGVRRSDLLRARRATVTAVAECVARLPEPGTVTI